MAKNSRKNFVDTIVQKDDSESFYHRTKAICLLIVGEKWVTQTWRSCADVKNASIELVMIFVLSRLCCGLRSESIFAPGPLTGNDINSRKRHEKEVT